MLGEDTLKKRDATIARKKVGGLPVVSWLASVLSRTSFHACCLLED